MNSSLVKLNSESENSLHKGQKKFLCEIVLDIGSNRLLEKILIGSHNLTSTKIITLMLVA